jgi:hypothetical protein
VLAHRHATHDLNSKKDKDGLRQRETQDGRDRPLSPAKEEVNYANENGELTKNNCKHIVGMQGCSPCMTTTRLQTPESVPKREKAKQERRGERERNEVMGVKKKGLSLRVGEEKDVESESEFHFTVFTRDRVKRSLPQVHNARRLARDRVDNMSTHQEFSEITDLSGKQGPGAG